MSTQTDLSKMATVVNNCRDIEDVRRLVDEQHRRGFQPIDSTILRLTEVLDGPGDKRLRRHTAEALADAIRVTKTAINQARCVLRSGQTNLIEDVLAGRLKLYVAARHVRRRRK